MIPFLGAPFFVAESAPFMDAPHLSKARRRPCDETLKPVTNTYLCNVIPCEQGMVELILFPELDRVQLDLLALCVITSSYAAAVRLSLFRTGSGF